jgi:hypothetical protein
MHSRRIYCEEQTVFLTVYDIEVFVGDMSPVLSSYSQFVLCRNVYEVYCTDCGGAKIRISHAERWATASGPAWANERRSASVRGVETSRGGAGAQR